MKYTGKFFLVSNCFFFYFDNFWSFFYKLILSIAMGEVDMASFLFDAEEGVNVDQFKFLPVRYSMSSTQVCGMVVVFYVKVHFACDV
jgi:hypothetical protein